jgi:NAD-dependent deacetylase
MAQIIETIARKIVEGGKNIIFTGAGISTESGIPDYRSQGGIWDKYKPVDFNAFMSSESSRIEYWRQWYARYPNLAAARPNSGHEAITSMVDAGRIDTVITQNIDGLHQQSGLPDHRVIELHGNTRRIRCMACRKHVLLADILERLKSGDFAPACDCGGYLKPDTISFGQAMPVDRTARAAALSKSSDCFLVVGSTLVVQPAAHLPFLAKQSGAFLAIVNLSETPLDAVCDARVKAPAGIALQTICDTVNALTNPE